MTIFILFQNIKYQLPLLNKSSSFSTHLFVLPISERYLLENIILIGFMPAQKEVQTDWINLFGIESWWTMYFVLIVKIALNWNWWCSLQFYCTFFLHNLRYSLVPYYYKSHSCAIYFLIYFKSFGWSKRRLHLAFNYYFTAIIN